jgi:inosose dehydratase
MSLKFGFQSYTWQMSGDKFAGKLPHILDVIQAAGGSGFEPEVCMLGEFRADSLRLKDELQQRGLQLGALCLALDWRLPEETDEERSEADFVFQYMKAFPESALILVQLPGNDRSDLQVRQKNALANINAVSKRASQQGIICAYHPNSPSGSIFRTKEDYEVLLNGIDANYCGYAPDSGHIAKGGMDVKDIFQIYRSLIKHVHFKDINVQGRWSALGQGMIDHLYLVNFLVETDYQGWVMVEEESEEAEVEPDQVTLENGLYIKDVLIPVTRRS